MEGMGEILKKARQDNAMRLEDLSAKCGYSKALISRIENDSVAPSIKSLDKISSALGLQLYEIFGSLEKDEPVIVKKGERNRLLSADRKRGIDFLTNQSWAKRIQPLMLSLKAKDKQSWQLMVRNGEVFLHVLQGAIEVNLGTQKYDLKAGDSIHHNATVSHEIRNIGNKDSLSILIIRPPYY